MLGRIAANLFWMSRHVERAESIARLFDAGYHMSLSERGDASSDHLMGMMQAAEMDAGFAQKHAKADARTVALWMLFDPDNAASVKSCLDRARANARAVRTAITTDLWESLNGTWIAFEAVAPESVLDHTLPGFLQWIKQQSNQFRGALLGTIMREDGFAFAQAGGFIERANNTARILDMKYFVLSPRTDRVGSARDITQWRRILRAASAHRAYRHVYHDRYTAENIVDFLIFRQALPRSLAFCANAVTTTLSTLERIYDQPSSCHDEAITLAQRLAAGEVNKVFNEGLHDYLTGFIAANDQLTLSISQNYNFH